MTSRKMGPSLFDIAAAISLVGIWPRFIEPRRLSITHLRVPFQGLKKRVRLALFSDLHWSEAGPPRSLLKKIIENVALFDPNYLFFLGDFLCFGNVANKEGLSSFLHQFQRWPSYTLFGNHDYHPPLTINPQGDYDVVSKVELFKKAVRLLTLPKIQVTHNWTLAAKRSQILPELIELIHASPFRILENQNPIVDEKSGFLCVGLPDISSGPINYKDAFSFVPKGGNALTLIHNPDLFYQLLGMPTSLVFAGHTHGGQINLPWISDKLIVLEHNHLKSGWFEEKEKRLYVTRGVGGCLPFRLFAPPELVLVTLEPHMMEPHDG